MDQQPDTHDTQPAALDAERFSRSSPVQHIHVLTEDRTGSGSCLPKMFPVSSLESVEAVNEKASTLTLRSGQKILVAIPCTTLYQKIYAPEFKRDDTTVLDLSDVTGTAAEEVVTKTGAVMANGTVYAGLTPDGKRMYVMPKDAPLKMSFDAAAQYVQAMNNAKVHGCTDWRVPTTAELKVLYSLKGEGTLSGTFNESGAQFHGFYLSSESPAGNSECAYSVNFASGKDDYWYKTRELSVRCVRTINPI